MNAAVAIAVDCACVVAFGAIGRASHAEVLDLAGMARTAGPFLGGLFVGVLAGRTWRRPAALTSGAYVWLGTLAGGMALRAVTGGGVAVSFVIVAGITLAALLLGWRTAVLVMHKVRSRRTVPVR